MSKPPPSYKAPTDEEVAICAYYIWESEGCPPGREFANWFEARAHLVASRKMDAGMLRMPAANKRPAVSKSPAVKERREKRTLAGAV